ncbi:uncharacterized protein LY89DRAFT_680159 [Mollisia scopiformis]|uniref:Uncharacterized protein n=1 Tax=Mollisia scopiformis TaxID=149040 RepID=A0A194XT70_MOLSC|nr:uncharacterized protein LY89DRAFT_680159 [Mollisia scopiformis]KUJ23403.1 hypothetical protein LY89DRAFT_680159 [Mollisia scopiformis]
MAAKLVKKEASWNWPIVIISVEVFRDLTEDMAKLLIVISGLEGSGGLAAFFFGRYGGKGLELQGQIS